MTSELIALTDPASPVAEAYRRLRANLTAAGKTMPLQAVLMAAAGPDDRKAQVVANLAVTFARVGTRVVLVDCDLRRPAQHALFGVDNTVGVAAALERADGPLPLQATAVPNLHVLPAGPAVDVPADLLASPAMVALIGRLRGAADLLLFDAPPIATATDALELATRVDGVLLTVRAGHTRRGEAQRAREQLAQVGARLLGAVMIDVAAE
ncbi:MAG: CpsD/CapB family tyrosine-protein kinase [Anaerolineae bacterium]